MRFLIFLDIGSQRELLIQFIRGYSEAREPIPMNLNNATLSFHGIVSNVPIFSVSGTIINAQAGKARFIIPATATSSLNPGLIDGQFKITISGDQSGPIRINGKIRLVGGAQP